jgi:hypothetical protein
MMQKEQIIAQMMKARLPSMSPESSDLIECHDMRGLYYGVGV